MFGARSIAGVNELPTKFPPPEESLSPGPPSKKDYEKFWQTGARPSGMPEPREIETTYTVGHPDLVAEILDTLDEFSKAHEQPDPSGLVVTKTDQPEETTSVE